MKQGGSFKGLPFFLDYDNCCWAIRMKSVFFPTD